MSTCAPASTSFSSAATAIAAPSRGSVSAAISSISTNVPGPAASRMCRSAVRWAVKVERSRERSPSSPMAV